LLPDLLLAGLESTGNPHESLGKWDEPGFLSATKNRTIGISG
jgi:hypothetical protein